MEEVALPQRPNARRRARDPSQPVAESRAKEQEGVADSALRTCDIDATCGGSNDGTRSTDLLEQPAGSTQLPDDVARAPEGGPGSQEEMLPVYRSAAVGDYKFEYLDHTADIQLHAWGRDLPEAFENCALAMFNYMSPLQHVELKQTRQYRAEGHDLHSLLYGFLDELLFVFATEMFLAARLTITSFDRDAFVIEAEGCGDMFDRCVHESGTEIKAITYSAMSIREGPDDADVFVIVDI